MFMIYFCDALFKQILHYFLDFFYLIRVNEYISVKSSSTIITNVLGNDFKNPNFFSSNIGSFQFSFEQNQ